MIFEFLRQNVKTWAVAVVPSMPWEGAGLGRLAWFRDELYRCFTSWPDALMDACDAVLCQDGPVRSVAELSLVPEFRRGHGSLYAALAEGGVDQERLRDALVAALPEGLPLLFAVDLSTFARPDARCSPGRMHCYAACRCDGRRKTVPGWSYSRVTGVEWGSSSWVFPVDSVRLGPADDQVEVAVAQVTGLVARLRAGSRCGLPGTRDPFAIFDSGYAPAALSWALRDTPAQVLVRLRDEGRRVFYAPPPPRRPGATGRPRRHGQRYKLAESAGWPPPDQELIVADSGRYGRVEVRAWHGLHQSVQARGYFARNPLPPGGVVPGTVIQVTAEKMPDGTVPDRPMWLWWTAPAGTACDLDVIWRGYLRRFDAEHGFRFEKGTLGWTCARPRTPDQADLWTWLVIAAYTQLHLARGAAPDLRRPWERPVPPGKDPSPVRARRSFRHIRARLGTPARAPKPSRPGPGRPKGSTRGPAPRYEIEKKTDTTAGGEKHPAG